jgi:hypothetical protein
MGLAAAILLAILCVWVGRNWDSLMEKDEEVEPNWPYNWQRDDELYWTFYYDEGGQPHGNDPGMENS